MAPKQLPAVLLSACTVLLALATPSLASDPDMLQDVCVADYKSLDGPERVPVCKKPENTMANDFYSDVLSLPGKPGGNAFGSAVTMANVEKVPGLNTLGVSMARVDYAPWGENPPHNHPRGTEVLFVLEGSLGVGFITTSGKHFARTICKGEMFVFPRGLVHYQKNSGGAPAVEISAFNSQLPGTQSVGQAMFATSPPVPTDVLIRALQIDGGVVESIRSKFPPK